MARARLARVVIPSSNYQVSRERRKHTRFLMNRQSGQMVGRTVVPVNRSDRTGVIRMKRPYDVNRDGDTNDKMDLQKGQIIGRVSRGSYAKPKRVTILRHWNKGRIVRTHNRR